MSLFAKPFSLTNAYFLGLKAGASTLLALLISGWLGNPDLVSAAFVAMLTCSPSVTMGLKNAWEQFFGSIIGGAFGTLMTIVGASPEVGIPISVTLSIWGSMGMGFPRGIAVASFTALFVQLVHFGGPLETFEVRMLAVGLAGVSGMVVNVVVSAFFYDRVFGKRVAKLVRHLEQLFLEAEEGAESLLGARTLVIALGAELTLAENELRLRRDHRSLLAIQELQEVQKRWDLFLHCLRGVVLEAERLKKTETLGRLLVWLHQPMGDPPEASIPLGVWFDRALEARLQLIALTQPQTVSRETVRGR